MAPGGAPGGGRVLPGRGCALAAAWASPPQPAVQRADRPQLTDWRLVLGQAASGRRAQWVHRSRLESVQERASGVEWALWTRNV
jgi:hypothetical protein